MSIAHPNLLSDFRKAAGLTQQELADAVGVHWITISKLERGKTRLSLEWIARLAKPLNVSPRDLLTEDFGEEPAESGSSIGERILFWRKKRGLSQADLGACCDATQSTIQRWETGGVPPADAVPVIARALEIDILTLFGLNGDSMHDASPPRLGPAHTEAVRLLAADKAAPVDRVSAREAARDKIIALAERLKIEAAQGLT